MIVLFKRLSWRTRSLVAWTLHTDRKVNFIPDKKQNQPFDMLIDKESGLKIAGISNILTFFCEHHERDFVYWLSGLNRPLNSLQMKTCLDRISNCEDQKLSKLLVFQLMEGSQDLEKLEFDCSVYQGVLDNADKALQALEKKMQVPVKQSNKKQKKGKRPKKTTEPKKCQPKKKDKKETVDPEYLDILSKASLQRFNQGEEIETSSDNRNILITSALPYVNNEPHLGNLIGAVLSADVFARYCRLSGYNIIYMCGTDEYGTATEIKALQEGLSPQEICDKYNQIHSDIYKKVGIDFDYFGRTSTPKHEEIVQNMYSACNDNGYIFEQTVQQTYCESCDRYLADRYITATCPECKSEAKGDQCDSCGKTLEVGDLIDPKCALCKNDVQEKDSNHLFLDLLKVKPQLEKFVHKSEETGFWTNNSSSITAAWLKKARARCITRDLTWGVPVPREGYEKKCFYVWFDAPIGYISITANYTNNWKQWWLANSEEEKEKNDVELYQFMGKDNVPFHTIFFPGAELASEQPWTLLKHINTTEYLNYENLKFSKTNNTGIFGSHLEATNIPIEVWRFYLLSIRPEGSDTQFRWEDFQDRNNSELLPNLGNFCHRVFKFIYSKNNKEIPIINPELLDNQDKEYLSELWAKTSEVLSSYEKVRLKLATHSIMRVSGLGNKYAQDVQVWTIKDDIPKRNNKLAILAMTIRLLGALFEPVMPSWSAKVYFIMNLIRNEKEQKIFSELRKYEDYKGLLSLLAKENLQGEMNLPVPLFKKRKLVLGLLILY